MSEEILESSDDTLLRVADLHTHINKKGGRVAKALNGVGFSIRSGEVYGLIGETGAGKSLTAWSLLRLVDPPLEVVEGSAWYQGRDLLDLKESELRSIRGSGIAFIVQNPKGSLNPLKNVGKQLTTVYRTHSDATKEAARLRSHEMLTAVGIPDPVRLVKAYAHQLSGGMAQRVLIAMALINEPSLLIADEPTTGLDATVQAQILDLIREGVSERNLSVMLITHDLGVVAHYCDRVGVMFAGRIVEEAPVRELFANPRHPYTQMLMSSIPNRATIGDQIMAHGIPPDLENLPEGCHFAYRCPYVAEICTQRVPVSTIGDHHTALCHFPHEDAP